MSMFRGGGGPGKLSIIIVISVKSGVKNCLAKWRALNFAEMSF